VSNPERGNRGREEESRAAGSGVGPPGDDLAVGVLDDHAIAVVVQYRDERAGVDDRTAAVAATGIDPDGLARVEGVRREGIGLTGTVEVDGVAGEIDRGATGVFEDDELLNRGDPGDREVTLGACRGSCR